MDLLVPHLAGPLIGTVHVPGDKSLSHRAVLFAAMAEGTSRLSGTLDSADVRSTIDAVRALGATVRFHERSSSGEVERPGLELEIEGWGAVGPQQPARPIDCGNSGTTARLLLGLLAGWRITATLSGDESLSARPMKRVTAPLEQMGATFTTTQGHLPVTVTGGSLRPIDYVSPVASAQVKTAILLAGLRASGRTSVREPATSRDHTERLLPLFGVEVGRDGVARKAWVDGPAIPTPCDWTVPGDPSSAAFFVVAGLLVRGSRVVVPDIALNPTRTGFLRVLQDMGADIVVRPARRREAAQPLRSERPEPAEPTGEVVASATQTLSAMKISGEEVPTLIDEVPILALAATQARGTTRFENVGELRVKESDRLEAICEGLTALGATVEAGSDWLHITGPTSLRGARLDSRGDHRLAMTWMVAGLIADGLVTVQHAEAVAVSYPGFAGELLSLGGTVLPS